MSFWVLGGGNGGGEYPPEAQRSHEYMSTTPTYQYPDQTDYFRAASPNHHGRHAHDAPHQWHSHQTSFPVKKLAFLVIRESSPALRPFSSPPTCPSNFSHPLERTASGLSISSADLTDDPANSARFYSDSQATHLVESHIKRIRGDTQPERILKSLINPRSKEGEFPLDDEALQSIFSAANELFFANKLSRRVEWDWSSRDGDQYASHVVGTTAIRRSTRQDGYETLIVLSSPILRDTKYNRRLLISTFLHEMIHSFLFVTCGLRARRCGGHTEGFRRIAEMIDEWVGKEYLRLSDMEADLEWFSRNEPVEERNVVVSSRWGGGEKMIEPRRPVRGHRYDDWQWYEQEGFPTGHVCTPGGSFTY